MGYGERKAKADKKKKVAKYILLGFFTLLLIVGVVFSYFVPPESWKYYLSKPNVGKRREGEMRIHFLDVGQGDCTIIELPDDKIMMIDGGNGKTATKKTVMRYLNALKVKEIDYLVVTHADSDHCGSLEEVFRYKKVLNAYLPTSFSISQTEYAETYAAAVKEGCELVEPTRGIDLSVKTGETPYVLSFLYPLGDFISTEDDNEESAVIWLDYMGQSALFCADIGVEVENNLLFEDESGLFDLRGVNLDETEILKVAHHGSKYSSGLAFLKYLRPQTAVISCGADNDYGHPTSETLQRLTSVGAQVYRTDLDGHIVVTITADGESSVKTIAS